MDKNPNRPNKNRNKFNMNQTSNMNFPHGKRAIKMNSMINYDLNNAFIPNDEYLENQYYPVQNMYQMQNPGPQTKEQHIKNMFKMYQHGQKKNFMQYNPSEYMMNNGENEMSLEDNAQIGVKKFNNKNWNKTRMQRKRKNNYKSNKDTNSYHFREMVPGNNTRAVSSENNLNYEEQIPEAYYLDNLNYNNNFVQKGGRKKATTVEYNNRNRKKFYKNFKQVTNKNNSNIDFTNNDDNNINNEKNPNNIKPYSNKSNSFSDIDNDSNLEHINNSYSTEEEKEDKNSQDIIILEEEEDEKSSITPNKEVIDIKKIKLVEKQESPENKLIKIKSENKISKNKIIPELTQMCSEKEINEREKERDLDRFEIDASAFPLKKPDKSRMVQKYKRKRGKYLNLSDPKEIRNISAINKSIEYLIDEILDCDKVCKITIPDGFEFTPQDIIQFIYDRYMAIYKTIDILINDNITVLNDSKFVENIGKMIRTTIIFFNLCLDYYVNEESTKEINSYIDNLLFPLIEYIKDMIFNESKYEYNFSSKDKDEFISYYLFIKLKKERKTFPKYYLELKDTLNYDESFQKIELVNKIYEILVNKDYENFVKILKDDKKCDYLTSCFMSLFFREICVDGLMSLSLQHKELTYKQIREYLTFEDNDEIKEFLIWYGITKDKSRYIVYDYDIVPIALNNKNKNYDFDTAPQKTNKRFIGKKKDNKLRKYFVNQRIELIKNNKYISFENSPKSDNTIQKIEEEKVIIKNNSLLNSNINKDKSSQNNETNDINNNITNKNDKINNNFLPNSKINHHLDESFISKESYNNLFPNITTSKQNIKSNLIKENSNKSEMKLTSSGKDDFLKPLSPKKKSFDGEKPITSNFNLADNNKSFEFFSQASASISSIEGQSKCYSNFNEQTIEFFCDVSSTIINKIISNRKLDFIYRLKFIVEKYKIKLELIENYINRRKFFVFNELKKCCLNKKFSKEYYKELVNYNSNLNSENTNENEAFKANNTNSINTKKFELLTYEDIIYFLIKDFKDLGQEKLVQDNYELNLINHLQINIYTTRDLIKSTKIISSLKLKKNLMSENSDGSEFTIIDNNININKNNKLSLIIKFIFVDQIIDLDSYIYDNQKNISKYAILIPFFDIIKSDPENQQILTKFFTILDLGLGSFIKKNIIFFFIKRDIEQTSDLYKDYQNMQNDFIFNLMQKYSTISNKNNIIYIDEDYENNKDAKEKIIYLSPIDEFGKCYREYIKYLNNKTFVELFENNKLLKLNSFNPKERLIPFSKHISELEPLINNYISTIENDLQVYLKEINCSKYFYSNKLCIEILIGFVMCKILIIYYQYICLSFANELFKVPFYISNNELLLLEDNLLNTGSIFKQINLDGYDKLWKKCFSFDANKKKNVFSYFDIFSEIICSYNLISDNDIQNYEYCFRKQYYDIDLEKKKYELAKNFVDFFNKIISKFTSNNNLNIRNQNTSKIIEKIYEKSKLELLNNISKILTNNSLWFNEGLVYINGMGNMYHKLEEIEQLQYNNNLSKKRKRNDLNMEAKEISKSNNLYIPKRVSHYQIQSTKKENANIDKYDDDNKQLLNNMIDINESINTSKNYSKFSKSGDMNDDYCKSFRTVKKYSLPNIS